MKNATLLTVLAAALAVPAIASLADSGLNVGDAVTPFHPTHIAGPDKGTNACPP